MKHNNGYNDNVVITKEVVCSNCGGLEVDHFDENLEPEGGFCSDCMRLWVVEDGKLIVKFIDPI